MNSVKVCRIAAGEIAAYQAPAASCIRRWEQAAVDACAWIARRGELGLEPAPELYLEHTVEIFRQVHRVMRKDGTVWLVVGALGSVGGEY